MRMNEKHICEKKSIDKLYRIGMFSAMNHVTIKTLRYYDNQDLLKPSYIDESNGYRYYCLSQVADLHQILALKGMGFQIEEIKEIQAGKSEKSLLINKKQQILNDISELMKKLAQVEQALAEDMSETLEHVLIKSIPEVVVATMRKRIESYDELFYLMPKMGLEMEQLGCECAMPEYCFTLYPEPGYKEEQILIEACEAVVEAKDDSDLVKFKVYPEIKEAACIFHRGSYDSLSKSYTKVLKYIEDNGYEISDSIRESYIDGVWNKDSEDEWLTEIQIPIRKCN